MEQIISLEHIVLPEDHLPIPEQVDNTSNIRRDNTGVGEDYEAGGHTTMSTRKHIEICLRRYDKERITNWDDMLERLQSENPSIKIKRSTLGEYLKEFNLGASRGNIMGTDDMKQIVLSELRQPRSQNCGAKKVWRTLKEDGYHIKRDLIEKIMKEVDPEGFYKRNQRRKTTYTGTAVGSAAELAPPVPAHSGDNHVSQIFPSTQPAFESHPYSVSVHPSPATPDLLTRVLDADIMSSQGVHVHETYQPALAGECESRVEYNVGSSDCHPGAAIPSLHGNIDDSSTVVSGEDMTGVERQLDDLLMEECSVPSGVGESLEDPMSDSESILSVNDTSRPEDWWDAEIDSCIPLRRFWDAVADAEEEEQVTQIKRLQIQYAISALLPALSEWCAFLPESSRGPFVHAEISRRHDGNGVRRYSPDYNLPEDQVADDALFYALSLKRMMSSPKTPSALFEVSEQLWEVRERLQDIGMPRGLLFGIGLRHVKILENLQDMVGDEDWILRDLWSCAAGCAWPPVVYDYELLDKWRPSARIAAKIASQAARRLASLDSPLADFYKAVSLYYEEESRYECTDESEKIPALLKCAMASKPSTECIQEMLRVMSHYRCIWKSDEVEPLMSLLLETLSASNATFPQATLAAQCSEIFHLPLGKHRKPIMRRVVHILRLSQDSRPSRLGFSLAYALYTCVLHDITLSPCDMPADMIEEAIDIQRRMAKFGEKDALGLYMRLVYENFESCIFSWPPQYKDALETVHEFVDLIQAFPYASMDDALCNCLFSFARQLHNTVNTELLSTAIQTLRAVQPILTSKYRSTINGSLILMLEICHLQRRRGDFKAALETSREAVALFTAKKDSVTRRVRSNILVCHARALLDHDADEAVDHIQWAWQLSENDGVSESFPRFCRVYAFHSGIFPETFLENSIADWQKRSSGLSKNYYPIWFNEPYLNEDCEDSRGWCFLLLAVQHITASRDQAMVYAQQSLDIIDKYKEWLKEETATQQSVLASVWGHKFVLLVILGKIHDAQAVLFQTIAYYRTVLAIEPHMARLPLLVLVEVLLSLSLQFPLLNIAAPALRLWKKAVCTGSTAFFEELVVFLPRLPQYMPVCDATG